MQAEPSTGTGSRFVSSRGLGSILLLLVFAATAAASKPERQEIVLRGRQQTLYHLAPASSSDVRHPPVLFIPGDGGCNRAAIKMARMISSLGYEVFGLDVRHYLSTSTHGRKVLTEDQMAADMEEAIRTVAGSEHRPVLLAGWSQGATMAVLAAARIGDRQQLQGVLTVALPEAGTLGWRRLDTLLLLFRKAQVHALEVLRDFDIRLWDRPTPNNVPDTLPTWGAIWQSLGVHPFWHLGELCGCIPRFHGTYTLNTVTHYFYTSADQRSGVVPKGEDA